MKNSIYLEVQSNEDSETFFVSMGGVRVGQHILESLAVALSYITLGFRGRPAWLSFGVLYKVCGSCKDKDNPL